MSLQSILRARADLTLLDIMLEVYDWAYCAGANLSAPPPHDAHMAALLAVLETRHRTEVLALREEPKTSDELPGWLLSLSQQADTIEPPAVEGWPV